MGPRSYRRATIALIFSFALGTALLGGPGATNYAVAQEIIPEPVVRGRPDLRHPEPRPARGFDEWVREARSNAPLLRDKFLDGKDNDRPGTRQLLDRVEAVRLRQGSEDRSNPLLPNPLPEVEGASSLSPERRYASREEIKRQIVALSNVEFSKDRVRVVSLVKDNTDTTAALHCPELQDVLVEPREHSLKSLQKILEDNPGSIIIMIGHMDHDRDTFAGMPITDLKALADQHSSGAKGSVIVVLGCRSAGRFGDGAKKDINSVEVVKSLARAMDVSTAGECLSKLTDPDLDWVWQLSTIDAMSNILRARATPRDDKAQGFDIWIHIPDRVLVPNQVQIPHWVRESPEAIESRSTFRAAHLLLLLAVSVTSCLTIVVVLLSAGVAFQGALSLQQAVLRAIKLCGRSVLAYIYRPMAATGRLVGHPALPFAVLLLAVFFGVEQVLLGGVPWIFYLYSAGIAVSWAEKICPPINSVLARPPEWLLMATGFAFICSIGTAVSAMLF